MTQGLMEVTLPQIYEKLEKCLKKNKDGDKYFYGDEVSLMNTQYTKLYSINVTNCVHTLSHISLANISFHYFQITLADIHFFACCETVLRLNPKSFDDFPKLAALYDRVKNNNKIDKWLDERQDSEI